MSAALTKAIMDSWKPWDLPQEQLTTLADALLDDSAAAESTIDGMPTTSWNGASRSAANSRASNQSA